MFGLLVEGFEQWRVGSRLSHGVRCRGTIFGVSRLTFRRCLGAARAVRAAEHGPSAAARLRGERIGLGRPSPGLAVLLYLADLQGRLVWHGLDSFVVLRAPYGNPGRRSPGWRSGLARLVEVVWPYGRDFGPAIVLLPLGLLGVLGGAQLLALLCVLGALVNVMIALGWPVMRGAADAVGWLRGPRRRRSALRALSRNWWIGLGHLAGADAKDADALLREALDRAMELADGTVYANGVLVCPVGSVTTSAGRQAVADAYTVTEVDEATEPVLFVKVPGRAARADAGSDTVAPIRVLDFLAWYFVAVALALALLSWNVLAAERAAGRPADFGGVLLWLFDQLWVLGELASVTPGWPVARWYGLAVQALGAVTIGVLIMSMYFVRRARNAHERAADARLVKKVDDADLGLIFINYRSGAHADRVRQLRAALAAELGDDRVFMDFWTIRPGERYPDALRKGVARCRVLVVCIHATWLDDLRTKQGLDWVHREIAMALQLRKVLFPVYFDDAPSVLGHELPDDIAELAMYQRRRIHWDSDTLDQDLKQLADDIREVAGGE
jgi:hypothetical protein